MDVRRAQVRAAVRQAGLLFAAAGGLTILNNYVPGSAWLNEGFLTTVGILCVFIFVFMWVGLHHPPGTSFLLAPLATAAYMVPGLLVADAPDGALSSVTIAIPACVLVAETIARTVGPLRQAEEYLRRGHDELSRLALRDDLTGLANRRAFVTVGEQLLRVAKRAGESVLLVYADLDGMKAINDRHGHAAGDEALQRAAQLLRETFREADLVARVGGDEFCVLLHGHAADAMASIDRLRATVGADRPGRPPVALSLGVAEGSPGTTIEDLIRRADTAMYTDKALRNDRPSP